MSFYIAEPLTSFHFTTVLDIKVHSSLLVLQLKRHFERVEGSVLLPQPSNLYLQSAEFTVRAAPAQRSGYYWCVYLQNGSGLAVEVNSITPGLCSVNMPQPEADALRDCLELRWERLALLIRTHWAAERLSSSLWPASSFLEEWARLRY